MGGQLPDDFLVWLEVIFDKSTRQWLACKPRANGYNYFESFDQYLKKEGLTEKEIESIKFQATDYPLDFPMCGRWVLPPNRFVIQNDDHDQQSGIAGLRYLQ
jgi:alpha-amylase